MFDFIKKEMEQQEKMKRRADILYPSMKIKDGSDNKKKFIGLGKSIFDDEDNDKNTFVKDYSSDKSSSKIEKKEKDYQKTADILYPTMKDKKDPELELIKQVFNEDNDSQIKNNPDKINTKIDKKEIKPEKEEEIKSKPGEMKVPGKKQGDFTGSAANIKDNEDKPELQADKEETKRKHDFVLKKLGLGDKDEYEIKDNTISQKKKEKQFDIIDNVKYPVNSGNKQVEKIKQQGIENKKERYKEDRDAYLKSPASKLARIGVDNVDNDFVKFSEKIFPGKEAAENLHMSKKDSYMNTDYAKKHKIYNNYKEAPEKLRDYFEEKISSQIGSNKLATTKGIYIDENSESSKNLVKGLLEHEDFIKKLKKYEKSLNANFYINDSISFNDNNWHNAIGKGDIRDMHINKNGDLELYICDVYDFNDGEKGKVQVGKDRQDKGEIIPYFEIYHVIIPKKDKEYAFQEYFEHKGKLGKKKTDWK